MNIKKLLLILLASRCKFYYCKETKILWRRLQDSLHSSIKNLPDYRKKRYLALKKPIDVLLVNENCITNNNFWYFLISTLNTFEKIAETLKRRICREN